MDVQFSSEAFDWVLRIASICAHAVDWEGDPGTGGGLTAAEGDLVALLATDVTINAVNVNPATTHPTVTMAAAPILFPSTILFMDDFIFLCTGREYQRDNSCDGSHWYSSKVTGWWPRTTSCTWVRPTRPLAALGRHNLRPSALKVALLANNERHLAFGHRAPRLARSSRQQPFTAARRRAAPQMSDHRSLACRVSRSHSNSIS